MGTFASLLAAIAWDPEIRNILGVMVGLGVLFGSVYLLVGSNVGLRTGLLVTLAGFFGWMSTMGVVWWIYGIGMKGAEPSWQIEELNYTGNDYSGLDAAALEQAHRLDALADLPTAQELIDDDPSIAEEILPPELFAEGADPDELAARIANITIGQVIEVRPDLEAQYDDALDGWRLLPVSDRQRGDASATADAFLGPDGRALFGATSDYILRDVFSFGGKPRLTDDSTWGRVTHKIETIVEFRHPTHYAVVQIQPVVPVEAVPGQAPATPVIDQDQPVISVVMVRDLGDKRFPAAVITVLSGALFALFASMLHRRDARIAEARSA